MTTTLEGQKREGDGAIRKNGKRLVYEDRFHYRVSTDDKATKRTEVLATAGIPRVGETLSGGGSAVCRSVNATRNPENPLWWDVSAEFSSEVEEDSSGADQSQSGDPTSWTPLAELQFETYQFYDVKDINDVPFTNSAGYPFASGIPTPRTLVRYDFEQFEASTTKLEDIVDRNETLNEFEFLGKAPKTLRLSIRKASIGYYYGYRVWRIDYSLTYKRDNWTFKALDIGPYYINNGQKVPFKPDQPPETSIQGFLNTNGQPSNVPRVRPFEQFELSDFSKYLRVVDPGA